MARPHEYSFPELLSSSWNFYRENFAQILAITLIIFVPISLVHSVEPLFTHDVEGNKLSDYFTISILLEFFLGVIATMAIAIFVKTKTSGKKTDFKSALLKSMEKWPVAIGTNLLLTLFLLGLLLLLVVPAIYFGTYWAFTTLAVALSDKKFKGAMDYSKSLVQGRWWKTFGILLGVTLIILAANALASLPFEVLPKNIFSSFSTNILINIVGSFATVALALLFLNYEKTKS